MTTEAKMEVYCAWCGSRVIVPYDRKLAYRGIIDKCERCVNEQNAVKEEK